MSKVKRNSTFNHGTLRSFPAHLTLQSTFSTGCFESWYGRIKESDWYDWQRRIIHYSESFWPWNLVGFSGTFLTEVTRQLQKSYVLLMFCQPIIYLSFFLLTQSHLFWWPRLSSWILTPGQVQLWLLQKKVGYMSLTPHMMSMYRLIYLRAWGLIMWILLFVQSKLKVLWWCPCCQVGMSWSMCCQ